MGGFMLIMQSKKANTELLPNGHSDQIHAKFFSVPTGLLTLLKVDISKGAVFVLFLLVARFTLYMLLIMIL
jgi:hypothetical protein